MIKFNYPNSTGREFDYIREAIQGGVMRGGGPLTLRCQRWLEEYTGVRKILLTHSCTAALEMAVILADIGPGDEVIMPSFTFVSTANAVVLRGGIPVFIDIRPDTLNIDESLIEPAITPRTRAVMPVHYAGVGCEMDAIMAVADAKDLLVIEDAAQGMMATYKGRPLGGIGHLGAYSFHETKNVISGEGGALLVNDERFVERAEIIWEKGTNRAQFFRGESDKYTWVDIGSSFLPSDIIAAFLLAQLQEAEAITSRRMSIYDRYHSAFAELEARGLARRPIVPEHCVHNAHMYYLLLKDASTQAAVLNALKASAIQAVFHYVPLHDAPAGRKYARSHGVLDVTSNVAGRLIRLPLWINMSDAEVQRVIDVTSTLIEKHSH